MSEAEFPFPGLDFPGRATVAVWEIAKKLSVTPTHILDHIRAGSLRALDTKCMGERSNMRVTVEEYRRFVLSRLTNTRGG